MSVEIGQIYPYFFEKDKSRALFNAKVWIGDEDTDPEFNQKVVVGVQENGSEVALNQPLTTNSGGGFSYNGSPVLIRVDPPYSMKVMNSKGQQEYYWSYINPTGGAPTIGATIQESQTLSSDQTTVTLATQLNGYISVRVNGDFVDDSVLVSGDDYNQVNQTEIELTDSYPAGTIVTVTQNDLSGDSKGPVNCYETVSAAESASLAVGTCFKVQELGGAGFIVRDVGYTKLTGDLTIGNGLDAELMPDSDGAFSALYFGLKDDPANLLGSQLAKCKLAAERAVVSGGIVDIPAVTARLSGTTLTIDVLWRVSPLASFPDLPGVSPTFVTNLSVLGGTVEIYRNGVVRGVKYWGDPSYKFQSETGRTQTTGALSVSSTNGYASVNAVTCSSYNTATVINQASIGITGKVYCDNPDTAHSGWGAYHEAIRKDGEQPCNVYGSETSISNGGSTAKNLNPYDNLETGSTSIVGQAISCGLNNFVGPISAFSYWTRTAASTRAHKGLVIYDESIAEGAYLAEAIAMPNNHGFSSYTAGGSLGGYMKFLNDTDGNSYRFGVFNASFAEPKTLIINYSSISYGVSTATLGTASRRFQSIYLQNAPDVVSDENKKDEKRSLTTDEINAGLELSRNVMMFKWISEIEEKGSDDTYLHTSVMAQKVWSILEENNLDPTKYGFISNDSVGWSIIQSELSMIMCAALIAKQDELETRIQALEA
jgi:hypothetical protein